MLTAALPAALDRGATLLAPTRAEKFEPAGGKAVSLLCSEVKQAEARALREHVAIKVVASHFLPGAPRTICSDHFLQTQPIERPIGFKLQALPKKPLPTKVVSAHAMRGCGLGGSLKQGEGLTRPNGMYRPAGCGMALA